METSANIFELAKEYKQLDEKLKNIDHYNEDEITALYTLVKNKKKFERHNRLAFFEPYEYQKEWIEASKHYHQRYLSSANRVGKTYGACMELAAHITGLTQ
ncbi:hypothetical protein A4J64_001965 [Salmonella enterica subsp. enterica serovar Losangeles]|nr:hypothetical protein [Salmonella enterica subsp. enterica serovar Losangeles]